jgi:NitT/TauT family transport system substrate-binding protein
VTRLRLLLNSPLTGANVFFALGAVDGSFRTAGLDLEMTPGRGAWTAAGRLHREDFDLAYGDVNALFQLAAMEQLAELPKAICVLHQHTPAVIAVPRGSTIHSARDLAGKQIAGHASDVALQLFPVFADASDLQKLSVRIQPSEVGMGELLRDMLAARHDAVFGYATTQTAALAGSGLAAHDHVRFLRYRDACPALYGSALMASPRMVRDQPGLLKVLVHTLLAKVEDARANPEAALTALLSLSPGSSRATESARWRATATDDMALESLERQCWGLFDPGRLARGIEAMTHDCNWPSLPAMWRVVPADAVAGMHPG